MNRFVVDDAFWQLFPDVRIGIVIAHGLDNRRAVEPCRELLMNEVEQTATRLEDEEIGTLPEVAPWRGAYQAFVVKPSKYRSSIESLLRSAKAGRLRGINPLVDLYNAVSLHHRLPCGGEDLATIRGEIHLTRAHGDEFFVPLGSKEPDPPPPGAVIYRDDLGVICSCWNWREADRTKLTDDTTNAFLCIEALSHVSDSVLDLACGELASLIETHLGATCRTATVDRGHPAWSLP